MSAWNRNFDTKPPCWIIMTVDFGEFYEIYQKQCLFIHHFLSFWESPRVMHGEIKQHVSFFALLFFRDFLLMTWKERKSVKDRERNCASSTTRKINCTMITSRWTTSAAECCIQNLSLLGNKYSASNAGSTPLHLVCQNNKGKQTHRRKAQLDNVKAKLIYHYLLCFQHTPPFNSWS